MLKIQHLEEFMEKYFEVLRRCSLFYEIKEEELRAVLDCLGARIVSYHKKETVLAEGQPANFIGIVLSGRVQIVRIDYFGNRSIVANAGPAELFGESFACAGVEQIPVDVVAAEDTGVLMIDCLRILRSCSQSCKFHRRLIYNLMKVVAGKNLMFHQKLEIMSRRSTREKLMTYLLQQAKEQESSSFTIPYNRQELADYLEVDRSGLSVEISRLCREGVIEADKRRFKMVAPVCSGISDFMY